MALRETSPFTAWDSKKVPGEEQFLVIRGVRKPEFKRVYWAEQLKASKKRAPKS